MLNIVSFTSVYFSRNPIFETIDAFAISVVEMHFSIYHLLNFIVYPGFTVWLNNYVFGRYLRIRAEVDVIRQHFNFLLCTLQIFHHYTPIRCREAGSEAVYILMS